ncbi:MAG TPA: response regulator [Lachnospiraceae bacterium]|nr:response regulator [Lachnospiraceae bacterium]
MSDQAQTGKDAGSANEELRDIISDESRKRLEEAILCTDLQLFTYYPGQKRCENLILNRRFSKLPTVWENFPEDFLEYTHCSGKDAITYRNMIASIDSGSEQAECTVRFIYHDSYIWEKIVLNAVRDSSGHTIRALGNSVDVTDTMLSRERLFKERVRLKTLQGGVFESFSFDLTKASQPEVQTKDEAMLKTEVSEELLEDAYRICPPLEQTNPETRTILLKAAARIPDKEEREKFISTCSSDGLREAIKEGHYSAELRFRRYVGEYIRWVKTNAEILPDPDSGDLIAFYYTKDINKETINKKISEEIIEKNYACVSCLDLQSGMFSVISGTDRELHDLDGMLYPDTLQKAAEIFVAPEDAEEYKRNLNRDTILAALEKNRFYTVYNRRRQTADGVPGRPLRRMKNDIFYLDSYHGEIVFLLTDVTAIFEKERESRADLETALLAAKQASSAKSNFLSRMSHEIRTPLNAIIGMDTIAAQSIGNPEKIADCVSKIGLSARYLLSLINDILDMSRIESGKMLLKNESFMFPEFISEVDNIIYPQVRAKGIDYECTVSNDVSDAYLGDEMKLQQILVNVLGNAVKFTSKGKISLDVSIAGREPNLEKLRFVVSDTGCGIAEENLMRIFDAFEQVDTSTTTVFGGTGLGLAITKNLVNLMGGSVTVRSIVGVGSEFTIDIPMTVDEAVAKPLKMRPNLQNMHTLIVDDDLIICEQAEGILKDIGMTGEWVTNGHEAIERVRLKTEEGKAYDFILIDWKMPDMDGIETTKEIRRLVGPNVTIIIISAYDWQAIETEACAAGANLMISKPLLRSNLISAFERALGEEKEPEEQEKVYDFTGCRILVAEDNDINAEIAKTLLESKKFSVDRVANGIKALEKFVQSPQGYYDAILMDVRMPLMDGLQTTANIRHWDRPDAKTVPIVAMTANAFDEDIEKSRAAGMSAHLSKPIDPELMYSTLQRLICKME